jgi:hypothetical protein
MSASDIKRDKCTRPLKPARHRHFPGTTMLDTWSYSMAAQAALLGKPPSRHGTKAGACPHVARGDVSL